MSFANGRDTASEQCAAGMPTMTIDVAATQLFVIAGIERPNVAEHRDQIWQVLASTFAAAGV
jgi:hypothetical protein